MHSDGWIWNWNTSFSLIQKKCVALGQTNNEIHYGQQERDELSENSASRHRSWAYKIQIYRSSSYQNLLYCSHVVMPFPKFTFKQYFIERIYTLCLKVYIILFRLNSTSPWSRSFHLFFNTIHIAQWHRQFVLFIFFSSSSIVHGNDTIIGNFIRWWEESLREWENFYKLKIEMINK